MRIFNHLAKLLVVATVLLIGCETDQPQTSEERDAAAIHMMIEELTDAYVDRDWDRFAGFFEQDAIWMPPGAAPLSGEEAWWAWVQAWWDASTVVDIGVTTEELIISGDWAIERHSEFQETIFGEAKESTLSNFKGMWIFRRQVDSSWKIARYIWNENTPLD